MKFVPAAFACLAALLGLSACSSSDGSAASSNPMSSPDAADGGFSDADSASPEASLTDAAFNADTSVQPDAQTTLVATIDTSKGTIVVQLNPTAAPVTTDNFRKYADSKFFDGLIFHRVIPNFMIQGGGLMPDMTEKAAPFDPIVDEAKTSGLSNLRGTIAMARTSDPNSATSQFFINTQDNTFLDPGDANPDGYAVFGQVIDGMSVVDAISNVATQTVGLYQNVPVEPIVINSLVVEAK